MAQKQELIRYDLDISQVIEKAKQLVQQLQVIDKHISRFGETDVTKGFADSLRIAEEGAASLEKRLERIEALKAVLAKPGDRPRLPQDFPTFTREGPRREAQAGAKASREEEAEAAREIAALDAKIAAERAKADAATQKVTRSQRELEAALKKEQKLVADLAAPRQEIARLKREEAALERQLASARARAGAKGAGAAERQRVLDIEAQIASTVAEREAIERRIASRLEKLAAAEQARKSANDSVNAAKREEEKSSERLLDLDRKRTEEAQKLAAAQAKAAKFEAQANEPGQEIGPGSRPRRGTLEAELGAQEALAQQEAQAAQPFLKETGKNVTAAMQKNADLQREIYGLAKDTEFVQERIARIQSGSAATDIAARYLQQLEEQQRVLARNRELILSQVAAEKGRAGDKLERARNEQIEARKKALAEQKTIAADLAALDLRAAEQGVKSEKEREAIARRRAELLRQRSDAVGKEVLATEELAKIDASRMEAVRQAGGGPAIESIDAAMEENSRRYAEVLSGGIDAIIPKWSEFQNELVAVNKELADGPPSLERQNQLTQRRAEILRETLRLENDAIDAIKAQELSAQELREERIKGLPVLERSLIGAFDDMFRRFQATLQFAISGALIFGAQQLARRFVETAIEVERAFADIETAFEFDVDFERGSRDFEVGVNKIRLATLQLADEFNTLPTEANEAAFQMVARFGDTTKALTALRAQLLATKVSTIDQSEVLRALSAVAENYAAATLDVSDALSIQQALMEREAAAVLNYGKALDIAVQIQQKFGVETEDTLEGVARLAPAFSQLGFTMERTAAIVASVSRELGQTGQNVAERLNRALGQLTEPGIRDGLLKLALANENFTLTLADFQSGPMALDALIRGYKELVAAGDSAAAFQLMNELGQRRELEVVAAVFNTTELQDSIQDELANAAGAAERRFGALNQTISETLKSLASGFERLAQNVQRLGLLDPFKALLVSVDKLLVGLNTALELIDSTFTSLGGLGDLLKTVVGFGIGGAGVARLGGGIVNAIAMGGSSLGRGAAEAAEKARAAGLDRLALSLGETAARSSVLAREFDALRATSVNGRLSLLQLGKAAVIAVQSLLMVPARAATALAQGAIERIAMAMVRPNLDSRLSRAGIWALSPGASGAPRTDVLAGRALGTVAALTALTMVATQLWESFKAGQDAAESLAETQADVEASIRLRAARGEFGSQWEEDRAAAQEALAGYQENASRASSETAAAMENVLRTIQDFVGAGTFDSDFQRRRTELLNDPVALEEYRRRNNLENTFTARASLFLPTEARREIIDGTQEFWRELTLGVQKDILLSRVGELEGLFEGANFERDNYAPDSPEGKAIANFVKELEEASNAAEDAVSDDEIANAGTRLTNAFATLEEIFANTGRSGAVIEGLAEESRKRIEQAQKDFSFGRIDNSQLDAVIKEETQRLRKLAGDIENLDIPDLAEIIEGILNDVTENTLLLVARQRAAFDRTRTRLGNVQGDERRIRALVAVADEELLYLQQYGSEDEVDEVEQERADLQRELADLLNARALRMARTRLKLAQTGEELSSASRALQNEITRQAYDAFLLGDNDLASELFEQAREVEQERLDDELDRAKRWAIGRARMAAPINSRLAALEGEIQATKIALGSAVDPLEIIELSVQLRELIAQRTQEQLNRLGAYLAAQAGVSDSLTALKGQLVHAQEELKVAAEQWDETSAEFYNAKLKIDQLKNELANAMLELEDINRRLGSDLSNDFEQAQLDLVEIAQKLKAPDLGELERARLELERERGLMAAEKAYFDDQLFNLDFLKQTGALGTSAYLNALRALQSQVDTTTKQGKEIFLQIQSIIDGLTGDVSDMAFNIPTNIKLPTLFEVRRAVAADQLGVNYQDNRRQNITIEVRETVDLDEVVTVVVSAVGGDVTSNRSGAGGSSIVTAGSSF